MENDDKIIVWEGLTKLDIPVERVIKNALNSQLDEVVIIGYDKEGDIYFASSKADGGDVFWLMEKTKKMLLEF